MIATRPPAAASTGLNPTANEYLPIHNHRVPAVAGTGTEILPPPPLKFVPRMFYHPPPPPPFLCAKLLQPSPTPPAQIVWAPVTYTYVAPGAGGHPPPPPVFDAGKGKAAPAMKNYQRSFIKTPAKFDSEVSEQRLSFPHWRRALPPRLLARKAAAKRRVWLQKNGAAPPATDEKPYPFGNCTTLMIRNIPNRLSQIELMKMLADHCSEMNKNGKGKVNSAFDLLYLPVDFARLGNKGYAFVNFTTVAGAAGLYRAWNDLSWCKFESKKIRAITTAKLQGKEKLKEHLASSVFRCETDEYLPVELTPACNGSNLATVAAATIGSRVKAGGRPRRR